MGLVEIVTFSITAVSGVVLIGNLTHRRFAALEARLDSVDAHLLEQADVYVRIREYDSDKRSTEAWLSRIEAKIDALLSARSN